MSARDWLMRDGAAMADAVRAGEVSATALVEASLAQIAATDGRINAFTDVTGARALQRAEALDAALSRGGQRRADDVARLPLLGVPFAVKNLFDIQGLPTLAGSRIERDSPPAAHDGVLVERMEAAGAVLVGALNMDEYAYGFTTENSHEGPCRNPHDPSRIAGGSSGGSAAAVAGGQVPITLGSDTNGSIRVPSSLCGTFGLKPTYGRLPRNGSYPFVASLDHLGPFARSARDLALSYDAMQGHDVRDTACVQRPFEPTAAKLADGATGLRVATLGGYFEDNAGPQARAAVAKVADALGAGLSIEWPEAARARAAAFLISNCEGSNLHLADLKRRPGDFEPLSRDRFLAGALLPAAWLVQAQRVRQWFARQAAQVFEHVDLLLAPATPVQATPIGTEWLEINGQRLPARPSLGLLTQPVSCIGLPVCCVPVWLPGESLPIGVQLIAAPWREDLVLRAAAALEALGVVQAPVAAAFAAPADPASRLPALGGVVMTSSLAINLPEVLAEMNAVFARYEDALVNNHVDVLDALFWSSPLTVRYGAAENLVGIEAIRAFRNARPSVGLARSLANTVITTYGHDLATAMTEFRRETSAKLGRQSQTWVRFSDGWRVVAAHVSLIDPPD